MKWKLCLFVILLFAVPTYANEGDIEKIVKAQFIYNFINFVVWPNDAFANQESSLRFCTLGDVGFSQQIKIFEGAKVVGRKLEVQIAKQLSEIKHGCHALFVGNDEALRLPELWNQINYMYVLSVGDRENFTDRGGIINIFRTADRVQFDVNIQTAIANGLFVDSDLLALARTIKRYTDSDPANTTSH